MSAPRIGSRRDDADEHIKCTPSLSTVGESVLPYFRDRSPRATNRDRMSGGMSELVVLSFSFLSSSIHCVGISSAPSATKSSAVLRLIGVTARNF